jgi:hypothetical protein
MRKVEGPICRRTRQTATDTQRLLQISRIPTVTVAGFPAVAHVESEANTYSRRFTLEGVNLPKPSPSTR